MSSSASKETRTAKRPIFALFLTLAGSGNHLSTDILERTSFGRVTDHVDTFFQAVVLADEGDNRPFVFKEFGEMSALDVLRRLYGLYDLDNVTEPTADQSIAGWLHAVIAHAGKINAFLVHTQALSHSRNVSLRDGATRYWNAAQRDKAIKRLRSILDYMDIEFSHIAFIRNPISVFLSRRERYPHIETDEELFQLIDDVYSLAAKGMHLVRYEGICQNNELDWSNLAEALSLDRQQKQALVDEGVAHSGEIYKWYQYPRLRIADLDQRLISHIKRFGFENPNTSVTHWYAHRFKSLTAKWTTEFRMIDSVANGSIRSPGAFVRHKRSRLAKVYFRLRMLSSHARNNYKKMCEDLGMNSSIPNLSTSLIRALRVKTRSR